METITLTFGDCAENHRGMQEIGKKASDGLSHEELLKIKAQYESEGLITQLISLHEITICGNSTHVKCDCVAAKPEAYLLVVRKGCRNADALLSEQMTLERDSKAFMYGRVVNKKARHNLCFSDFEQAPSYEEGKGTVVSFSRLPELSKVRAQLGGFTEKLSNLQCEGNYYYDINTTYIGFHGDTERRIVVAVRLGASFPIHYQWYRENEPVDDMFSLTLHHGDIYFMSDKAVGYDWKKKKIFTLRHAAGDLKNM